jgi:hypothetical protein
MKLGKITLIIAAFWGASAFSIFGQGVGINTTGAPANPNSMLDVAASGKGMLIPRMTWSNKPAGLTASDAGMIFFSTDGDGTYGPGFYFFNGTIWTNLMASTASASGSYIQNQSTIAQSGRFRIDGNGIFDGGNVGIGSVSPSDRLDVNGDVKISGLINPVSISSITSPRLLITSSTGQIRSTLGGPNEVLKMNSSATNIEWGSLSATSLSIPASTGDMLYYNGTNWVVLNVPNTSAGGSGVYYALTLPNAGSGNPSWQATTAFTVNGDNMGNCIASANINLNTFNLTGTGNININGKILSNGIQELSDFRFKKNIRPLTNVLSKVLSVQGVSYDWKTEEFPQKSFSDKTEFGFIAQELEKYFPNVVLTDENGYKSVQYSHMVPVLLEAIKEQQRLIDQLQGAVSNLSKVLYGTENSNSIENASVELIKK